VVSPTPFRPEELLQAEIDKFKFIYSTIREWLESSMGRTEKEWQQKILSFIQLIFPKYVAVLENVQIEDHYSIPGRTKKRFIDIALVDANGNLDVIEIKRPFDDVLLSKTQYRDNFVPTRDLSGTVMQAEKYLFIYRSGASPERRNSPRSTESCCRRGCQSGSLIPRHFSFWAATENLTAAQSSISMRRSTWRSSSAST